MTWHIVSQICWSICNLEPLRPSAALNATELARPWAIPSRPARPAIPRRCCPSIPVVSTWKVGAQKAVYGKSQSSFALAAGKTNLGHLEGRKRWNSWNKAVPWNIMKGHMKHHETFCWVGKWTMSILSTNTAKSLWLFGPGAAGVAGLSKAAWSSSCSSPSPDPTQCRRIGCDCHRSCRVNEHKCQHCYGSASAALKIWIKQKTELAHWQIK